MHGMLLFQGNLGDQILRWTPPTFPEPITKARGNALAIKSVTVVALDLGKELLFYLEDQEGNEKAPKVEYIERESPWWKFWD